MKEELEDLLRRYGSGTASKEDEAFLESWYMQHREEAGAREYTPEERLADAQTVWDELGFIHTEARQIRLWPRIAAAASVILCLSAGAYFMLRKTDKLKLVASSPKAIITPGGNKAILITGNGKHVFLQDVKNGEVMQQQGATVTKIADGEIVYRDHSEGKNDVTVFDTLTIPRGGHFQLVFADGSKAWLNAATTIC